MRRRTRIVRLARTLRRHGPRRIMPGSGARSAPTLEEGSRVEVVIGVVLIVIAAIEIAAISAIVARSQPGA